MSDYTAHDVVEWTGYLFHDEVNALQQLARSLSPNPVVVNIGAGNGTSGLAFLQSRPDLFLWTIEKQRESSPFGCLEGEWAVFDKAGLWPCERYDFIHGDSQQAGVEWPHGIVDAVFIDGDHSFEGCSGDIAAWLPHIKAGGLLIVHDYHKAERYQRAVVGKAPHPKPWAGVDRAVDQLLLKTYPVVLHVDTLIAFKIGAEIVKPARARKKTNA